MGYHHTVAKDVKRSLRQNYLIPFMLDLAFVAIFIVLITGYRLLAAFVERTDAIGRFITDNTLATITYDAIPPNLIDGLLWYLSKHLLAIIALAILVYVAYCLAGAAVWNYIVKKKVELKHRSLFLRGNLLVIVFGVVAFVLFFLLSALLFLLRFLASVNPVTMWIVQVLIYVIVLGYILFFINMVMLFHYELIRHESVRTALRSMLSLSFTKGHHFFAHYAIVVVAMVAVNYLIQLVGRFLDAQGLTSGWWTTFNFIAGLVILLLALGWVRYFVDTVVQRVKPHKTARKSPEKTTARKRATKKTARKAKTRKSPRKTKKGTRKKSRK